MERSKRAAYPRLDQLLEVCNEKREALDEILSPPVEAIQDSAEDTKQYMLQLKEICNNFTSVCHDCICALFKCGSIAEANELKKIRDEKKMFFKERVSVIKSLVEPAIVNNDPSCIYSSNHSLRSAPAVLECVTDIPYLRDSGKDSCSLYGDVSRHHCNLNTVNMPNLFNSASKNMVCGLGNNVNVPKVFTSDSNNATERLNSNVGLSSNLSIRSSSSSEDTHISPCGIAVNSNLNVNATHFSPNRTHNDNYISTNRTYSIDTNLHLGNKEPNPSANIPMNAAHSFSSRIVNASSRDNSGETCFRSHSKAPKILLQSSFQRIHNDPLDNLSNAFSQDFSINQGTCRSNAQSSRKVTFSSPNTYTTTGPEPPYRTSRTSDEHKPPHINSDPPWEAQNSNYSISNHVLKQELFHKPASPYTGEPQRFNFWFNSLLSRMSNLSLSAWDRLLILEVHTAKEPQKLVQKCMIKSG